MINYFHRRSSSAAAQRLFSSSTRLTTSKQNFISCEHFCQHHHHLVFDQVDCSQAEGGEEQLTGDVKAICFLQLYSTRASLPPTLSNLKSPQAAKAVREADTGGDLQAEGATSPVVGHCAETGGS